MSRLSLALYNLLFPFLLLLLLPGYLVRIWKRGGYRSKIAQRIGIIDRKTMARLGNGRIWLHAVSVGEVGIALKFADEFHRRNPQARFVISTTTSTGLAILEKRASDRLEPLANPIDFPILTSRLVKKIGPSALIMIEADLWPNRIEACRELGIPVALINARLSSRSESRYRLARPFASSFFNQLSLLALTEENDRERWLSLRVSPEILHWTGNIKYDRDSASLLPDDLSVCSVSDLPKSLGWEMTDPLFLAASTHEGEEVEVARAYLELRREVPTLRLVIAPRHVERHSSIAQLLKGLGLSVSIRSQEAVSPSDVLLIDTTGELANWYPLSTCVFVGKSLPASANRGGQNMIEPLQAGKPVLIGPYTGNFEPLASHLVDSGAAIRVSDSISITAALHKLLNDRPLREQTVAAAELVLKPHQGATTRTCEFIEELLLRTLPEKTRGA